MIWRIIAFLLIMAIGLPVAMPAYAKNSQPEKYASLVLDADTGAIISSRYADSPRYPASLTKMMTLLMVFDALERGDIKLKDRMHISRNANAQQPSKLGLPPGSSIRVEDAILALVTKSANDIAVAVAEYIGQTESNFALQMTRRARDIGMSNTTFRNASGLPDSRQITTARDMAKLASYILHRYPHYYGYFSTKTFTYQGKTYRNHNRLMESYNGMDGFKTGYINASGFNLVASARRDGRRLIGVVFGGRTTATRNAHMADILNAGFKNIGKGGHDTVQVAIAPARPPIPARKPGVLVARAIMQQQPAGQPALQPAEIAAAFGQGIPAATPEQIASLTPMQAQVLATPADDDNVVRQLVRIQPTLNSGAFDELTGQGDLDPAAAKRLETGMLAMAVHKNRDNPRVIPVSLTTPPETPAPLLAPGLPDNKWAVQIGAFNSRVATDDALRRAQQSLPAELTNAQARVVPMRAGNNLHFRARLTGFSKDEARAACRYIRDCMTIAPQAR